MTGNMTGNIIGNMIWRHVIAGLMLATGFATGPGGSEAIAAGGCALVPENGGGETHIRQLQDGIFLGSVVCQHGSRPISVWTMTVDATASELGVRDNPLFAGMSGNPIIAVASIGYGQDSRFTVFRRRQSLEGGLQPGAPDRVFGTLCATPEAAEPLDCSIGPSRVKMRVDIRDVDADGAHDRAFHEISIYDGTNRLQVVYMETDYDARPHAMVRQWLGLLNEIEAIDLPG